ncbi:hypothetical protein PFISCL1PPCAC_18447, partial [Pristionchus fissidentatus]
FGAAAPAATSTPLFGAPAATSTPLFGAAPAASTSAPLFGAAPAAATTSAPLFGAPTTSTAAPSLFGAPATTAAAPSAGGLFGAPATTSAAAPLFGAAPAATTAAPAAGGLFGATATTSAAPSLFGAPAAAAAAQKPLFGAAPAATGTTTSLFGAPAAAPAASAAGGLFGAPATTSLFGATAAPAAATSTGLGGAATVAATLGGGIGGGLGAGATDVKQEAQIENVKESKVEQPQLDLLAAVRAQIAENKKLSDQFACNSSEACLKIEDKVRQLQRRLSSIAVSSSGLAAEEARLRARTVRDLRLGQVATTIQENAAKNVYTPGNQGRQYMIQLIRDYNDLLSQYSQTIEELQQRVTQLMNGTATVSEKDISDHLARFDVIFSHVAGQVVATNDKINEIKEIFSEEHPGVLAREMAYNSFLPSSSNYSESSQARRFAGEPALPSQATAMQIGQYIRQSGVAAPAPAATGGLFGSTAATGGGLFGASTAAKPFSFATPAAATGTTGSLFGTPTTAASTTTSLFGAPATSAASSTPTFGKSIANSSSGLLFSSTPTKPLFGK